MKWHLLAVGLMTKDSQVIYCCTSCRITLTCGRRVSFEVYRNNFFIKVIDRTSLNAPVVILAALIWIFSNSFFSYCVQLSQMTSAYANKGRINAM